MKRERHAFLYMVFSLDDDKEEPMAQMEGRKKERQSGSKDVIQNIIIRQIEYKIQN